MGADYRKVRRPEPIPLIELGEGLDTLVVSMVRAEMGYTESLLQFEKRYLTEVLSVHHNNISVAARKLGMHRNTLMRRMQLLGMTRKERSHANRKDREKQAARNPAFQPRAASQDFFGSTGRLSRQGD